MGYKKLLGLMTSEIVLCQCTHVLIQVLVSLLVLQGEDYDKGRGIRTTVKYAVIKAYEGK